MTSKRQQHHERRQRERRRQIEHRSFRHVLPACTHQRRSHTVAHGGVSGIATQAQRHSHPSDEHEAHGGDRRAERAARHAVKDFREVHEQPDRMDGEHQGARREHQHAERGDAGLVPRRIDQRAGRHLADHGADRADGERQADCRLRPTLSAEIHGDEWTEPGLDVGYEKIEPVQAAPGRCVRPAHARWRQRRRLPAGRRGRRRGRRRMAVTSWRRRLQHREPPPAA